MTVEGIELGVFVSLTNIITTRATHFLMYILQGQIYKLIQPIIHHFNEISMKISTTYNPNLIKENLDSRLAHIHLYKRCYLNL